MIRFSSPRFQPLLTSRRGRPILNVDKACMRNMPDIQSDATRVAKASVLCTVSACKSSAHEDTGSHPNSQKLRRTAARNVVRWQWQNLSAGIPEGFLKRGSGEDGREGRLSSSYCLAAQGEAHAASSDNPFLTIPLTGNRHGGCEATEQPGARAGDLADGSPGGDAVRFAAGSFREDAAARAWL